MDDRTMDDAIAKVLAGEATDLDRRQLQNWRATSLQNERIYQTTRAVWREASAPDEPVASPPPAASLINEAERRRSAAREGRARVRLPRSAWVRYGLVGAAAVVVATVLHTADTGREPHLAPLGSSANSANVVTMSLSDGSVVRLGAGSSVTFPATDGRREVALKGKAFFGVSHGDEPFVVRTAAGEVSVRGTRFEVSAAGEEMRVVVVEGTVSLRGRGDGVRVEAGQVGWVEGDAPPRVVEHDDVWSLLEWPGGLLIFESTPLEEVARELERRFQANVVIDDPELATRRITAWFDEEPLEEVVSAVCVVAGARCAVAGRRIRIRR